MEFTNDRWIPHTKLECANFDVFFDFGKNNPFGGGGGGGGGSGVGVLVLH